MKKSTKIVKKLLAIFLVVLMSINTLGSAVSDNDGSAFITKAEFDSLKNDFKSQIDQYNTSIDAKIDGAIASYLAGLNITTKEDKSILLKKYDEYTIMNKVLQNEYAFPDVHISLALTKYQMNYYPAEFQWVTDEMIRTGPKSNEIQYTEHNSIQAKFFWLFANGSYSRASNTTTNKRNTVMVDGVINDDYNNADNVVWFGQSQNKIENWDLISIFDCSAWGGS